MQVSPLIEPIKKRDIDVCAGIVFKATKAKNVKREMLRHLKRGAGYCVKDENAQIIAFAFFINGERGVSLTHFYIDPFYRKKSFSFWFYTQIFALLGDGDVYIYSKDVFSFKDMLEPTNFKDEYKFKRDFLSRLKAYDG